MLLIDDVEKSLIQGGERYKDSFSENEYNPKKLVTIVCNLSKILHKLCKSKVEKFKFV